MSLITIQNYGNIYITATGKVYKEFTLKNLKAAASSKGK